MNLKKLPFRVLLFLLFWTLWGNDQFVPKPAICSFPEFCQPGTGNREIIFATPGSLKALPGHYEKTNLEAAEGVGNILLWNSGLAGLNLTGQNQTIGYWDAGKPLLTHQEYSGRVSFVDSVTALVDGHATQMAGTMIALGMEPNAHGMASQAEIVAYEWNNDTGEMGSAASAGLILSEHPYANAAGWEYGKTRPDEWTWYSYTSVDSQKAYQFGYYDQQARDWDSLAYLFPNYLIVKAAGNYRSVGPATQPVRHWVYTVLEDNTIGLIEDSLTIRPLNGGTDGFETLTSASVSKNVLVVGGVKSSVGDYTLLNSLQPTSSSGFGPTDDGRIKPDIVAPASRIYTTSSASETAYGTSDGTSAASAIVAGSVALLQEHYHNIAGDTLSSASVRALLAQAAEDIGNLGPDYKFGWGFLNTERAARFLSAHIQQSSTTILKDTTLLNGETIILNVSPASTLPLKVTVAWTDPPGSIPDNLDDPTEHLLANDLDVQVSKADSIYYPWVLDRANPGNPATTGDNSIDNIEQIYISNPVPGHNYTITVSHKNSLQSGSQKVSILAGSAEPEIELLTVKDGNWSDETVWENGQFPGTSFYRAYIQHKITLDSDTQIRGITFAGAKASLYLSGKKLTISGSVLYKNTAQGFFGDSSAGLTINGWDNDPASLTFAPSGQSLGNLTINASGDSVTLSSPLTIYKKLNLQNGTLVANGQTLTLVASRNNAASLLTENGSLFGELVYSRFYFEESSGWRMVSVPFSGVRYSSLNTHFHTQGGNWANMTVAEPNSNLWTFDALTQQFKGYYGNDSTFSPGSGYLFYMFESFPNRSPALPAVWEISGNEPDSVVVPLYKAENDSINYNFVGNPFAAVVDWAAISGANHDIGTSYAVWDASGTSEGGTSGYSYYNATDGLGEAGRYIAPMQAFFVTAKAENPELTFRQNQKTEGIEPRILGKENSASITSYIRFNLFNEAETLIEKEIYLVINKNAAKGWDKSDVPRFNSIDGSSHTLSFLGPDNTLLAFEGRSLESGREDFELMPQLDETGNYTLSWVDEKGMDPSWALVFRDLETGTQLDMRKADSYTFYNSAGSVNQKSVKYDGNKKLTAVADGFNARFEVIVKAQNSSAEAPQLPLEFTLFQNYPNPFNPETTISYSLPKASLVRIEIFNTLGQKVYEPVNERKEAGIYAFRFDASVFPSGVYFYRITAGKGAYAQMRKMLLIK